MSKRSDKLNHAAHVKKSTRGTSNELSFSVLDAARNALDDGKDPSSDQARGFGRIRLFTLPIGRRKPPATPKKDELAALMGGSSPVPSSVSSTPSLVKPVESDKPSSEAPAVPLPQAEPKAPKPAQPSPSRFERAPRSTGRTSEEEIAWRKARRRKGKILAGVLCAVIIVTLAGAGLLYLYQDNVRYQQNTQLLQESADSLTSTDEFLLALDDALQDPLGDQAETFFNDRQGDLASIGSSLQLAESKADEAMQGLRETVEREAADALMATSAARQTLVDQGWRILEDSVGMKSLYERVREAWQQTGEADSLAREAAQLAGENSQEAITRSTELSNEASSLFSDVRATMEVLAQEDAEVDLSAQIAYLDKRIEALGYAVASNDALLARDTAAAVEQNDAYNAADKEAASLAAALPIDPGQPVLDALEERLADPIEAYEAARGQASTSDAFLRDYFSRSA
ncbi:MAG TPA: hypothetical protein IAB86_06575 [Candidatus Aphodovivens avicola]|nr:hypothetical protein [Candidatus Aphodovivens avicola]